MEESWINLNAQQSKTKQTAGQLEGDLSREISGPSPESTSSTSSSTSSLDKQGLTASGTTDENLSASFGTLLKKGDTDSGAEATTNDRQSEQEKERRDTITASDRPKDISQEGRQSRQERRDEKARAVKTSYWKGFFSGISLTISTLIVGLACWKLNLRLRNFGAH